MIIREMENNSNEKRRRKFADKREKSSAFGSNVLGCEK
jgi:hypothetical protein